MTVVPVVVVLPVLASPVAVSPVVFRQPTVLVAGADHIEPSGQEDR